VDVRSDDRRGLRRYHLWRRIGVRTRRHCEVPLVRSIERTFPSISADKYESKRAPFVVGQRVRTAARSPLVFRAVDYRSGDSECAQICERERTWRGASKLAHSLSG
jgi:hypothetical protein